MFAGPVIGPGFGPHLGKRPSVGGDVMNHVQKDVLVSSQLDHPHPPHPVVRQIEAADGFVLEIPIALVVVAHPDDLEVRRVRRVHHLKGHSFALDVAGAQDLVPADYKPVRFFE